MIVVRTTKHPAHPLGKLVRPQQTVRLDDLALCVDPLGLYGVKPRALLGRRQLTILTPSPLSLTRRLCFPSHLLTSLEMCQEALSQMSSRTFLPISSSFSKLHWRNCVVMELTDLPSTKRSHVSSISGR